MRPIAESAQFWSTLDLMMLLIELVVGDGPRLKIKLFRRVAGNNVLEMPSSDASDGVSLKTVD